MNCHMDMEFVAVWYETKYLTGINCKWAMKPGSRIVHYTDGIIYKASNITDAIVERLISENPEYEQCFTKLTEGTK